MAYQQTKQIVAPVGISTYLLHRYTSCKLTKELKNSTIKILHSLPTILHLGENFSNLSQVQHSTMSSQMGCTSVVAYVPPAHGFKSSVVLSNELYRAQASGRIWSNFLQYANFTPEYFGKHDGEILLRVNLL